MSKSKPAAELPPPKPYQGYRPATVADYTGLSERAVYYACKTGAIRSVRVGRSITIPGSEILRLIGQDQAA